MNENRLNTTMSVRIKKISHEEFQRLALSNGLSVNQYLKFLVLKELGQHPPEKTSQAYLTHWLRGK